MTCLSGFSSFLNETYSEVLSILVPFTLMGASTLRYCQNVCYILPFCRFALNT